MLSINKKIVLDEEMKPFAVQIPISEFNKIEEIFENYGLAKIFTKHFPEKQAQKISKSLATVHLPAW